MTMEEVERKEKKGWDLNRIKAPFFIPEVFIKTSIR